jgi:hypothetical protein
MKPILKATSRKNPGEQKEEREHPRLKLHPNLKRKADQHDQGGQAVSHKNTLGTVWE